MATDLEKARQRAANKLTRLQQQFNFDLPAQMQQVQADIARLDDAIEASHTQVDATDLIAKYGPTAPDPPPAA